MEGIINSVSKLFGTYGFRSATIVIATVVIVNLIKKPIVKKAERLAADCGLDKSIVTKYITVLPVAVAFVLELLTELVLNKFAVFNIDYAAVATSAVLYGGLAIATYESVKKQLEAYAAKHNSTASAVEKTEKESDPAEDGSAETDSASPEKNSDSSVAFSANGPMDL